MGLRERIVESEDRAIALSAAANSSSCQKPVSVMGSFEFINLLLPFLFLLAGAGLLFKNPLTENSELIWSFAVAYIFFDSTHVLFTFLFLSTLPEAKALVRESLRSRKTWAGGTILLASFLPIFFILQKKHVFGPWVEDLLFAVPLFLFYRHSLKQIFGVSMLYNARVQRELAQNERAQLAKTEKSERICFSLFVFAWVAYMFFKQTSLKIFNLENVFLILSVLLLVPIIWTVLQYRGPRWRNKKIYLVRLALFPMAGFAPLGMLGVGAVHGTEYLFVVWNLIKKSALTKKGFLIALLPLVATLILLPRILQNFSDSYFWTAAVYQSWSDLSKEIILTVYLTVQYLHYYVDGLVFRLSDPLVRKHMGTLLGLTDKS